MKKPPSKLNRIKKIHMKLFKMVAKEAEVGYIASMLKKGKAYTAKCFVKVDVDAETMNVWRYYTQTKIPIMLSTGALECIDIMIGGIEHNEYTFPCQTEEEATTLMDQIRNIFSTKNNF